MAVFIRRSKKLTEDDQQQQQQQVNHGPVSNASAVAKEVEKYNLIYCIDEAEEHLNFIKGAHNE